MRFWPALLESERLNVRNSTTSAILRCSVHFTIYMYLYSYRRETARQLRMYAQLTRCFSAVAELLVSVHNVVIHIQHVCVCCLVHFWIGFRGCYIILSLPVFKPYLEHKYKLLWFIITGIYF